MKESKPSLNSRTYYISDDLMRDGRTQGETDFLFIIIKMMSLKKLKSFIKFSNKS